MNKQINTAVTGRVPVFCSTLTPRPWEADGRSCRGRLKERSLHLCLGAILKVCVISGGEFNQCEIAATPEMDFPNGNRGLVHVCHVLRPSCLAVGPIRPLVVLSPGKNVLLSSWRCLLLHTAIAFSTFLFVLFVRAARAAFSESGFIQQLSRLRSDVVQFEGRTPSERAAEGIGEARRWRGHAKLCV